MLDILSMAFSMAEENSIHSPEEKENSRVASEVSGEAQEMHAEDHSRDLTLGEVLEECLGPTLVDEEGNMEDGGDDSQTKQSKKPSSPEEMLIKMETEATEGKEDKPGLSYIALISTAIQSSPENKMLLSEIYSWIAEHYPYFSSQDRSWRNSIRHNLSLNECFIKTGRSENGKGNYWAIHPANVDDFAKGDFRRRRARRRVRQCNEQLEKMKYGFHMGSGQTDRNNAVMTEQSGSTGYVPMTLTKAPASVLISMFGAEAILTPEERLQQLRSYQTMDSAQQNMTYSHYPNHTPSYTQHYRNSTMSSAVSGQKVWHETSGENRPACMYERPQPDYHPNHWNQAAPSHTNHPYNPMI